MRRSDDELARAFWAKVDLEGENGCWLWRAGMSHSGYGVAWLGRSLAAHRAAYTLMVGPIPEGLELDHLCRVRNCVNPDHLELVTRSENVRRSSLAAVTRARAAQVVQCPQGHPYDEQNTYVYFQRSTGKTMRNCRSCRSVRSRRRDNIEIKG